MLERYPLLLVILKAVMDKIQTVISYVVALRNLIESTLNITFKFSFTIGNKGWISSSEFEQDDSKAPNISFIVVAALL